MIRRLPLLAPVLAAVFFATFLLFAGPAVVLAPEMPASEIQKVSEELKDLLALEANETAVIVHLNSRPSDSQISALETLGAKVKYRYKIIDAVAMSISPGLIEKVAALGFVKKIEPDAVTRAVVAQSAIQIGANKVWEEFGAEGENVVIAILDTGIDNEHGDLQNVVLEMDFTGEGTDDLNGHGTHVASVAAGSGAGWNRDR